MALAGRNSRSGGGRRLLLAALVVTILVVLLDASLKSRSPAPAQILSAQAWVDRALPVIATSTAEGRQVEQVRTQGLGMPATQIRASLQAVATGAEAAYRSVLSFGTPPAAGGAPGLLQACLLVRAQAAASLASAVTSALSAPGAPASATDPVVAATAAAGAQLQVADQAYALFARDLPKDLGIAMPASSWVGDPTLYQAATVQTWLAALRNATNLQPVHQVSISAVSFNPPPVGIQAGVQDIPPTRAITVTVVVSDTGNQAERNLTVTASVAPNVAGSAASVRNFASLSPGTSEAVTLGPLLPPPGVSATVTVTVTGPAGSPTAPVSTAIGVEVAAPPPPSTTTTVVGATPTTVPGSAPASGAVTTTTTPAG